MYLIFFANFFVCVSNCQDLFFHKHTAHYNLFRRLLFISRKFLLNLFLWRAKNRQIWLLFSFYLIAYYNMNCMYKVSALKQNTKNQSFFIKSLKCVNFTSKVMCNLCRAAYLQPRSREGTYELFTSQISNVTKQHNN